MCFALILPQYQSHITLKNLFFLDFLEKIVYFGLILAKKRCKLAKCNTKIVLLKYQKIAIFFYHKEMITQEALNKALLGRVESVDYAVRRLVSSVQAQTLLLPIQQKEIVQCLLQWQRTKVY